jgi:ComF family protein
VRELLRGLLDLLAPPACAGCRRPLEGERVLCPACDGALPRLERPLPAPAPLAACVAAVEFRGAVEPWIHRFKYPRSGLAGLDPAPQAVARMLILEAAARALILETAARLPIPEASASLPPPAPQLVVPVPLHARRLRARGFNPAGLLARALASELGARCDPVALRRVRDTPSQTGLDRRARRRNVRNAFAPRRPVPPRVWLVDDVVTTGSTLTEAARALRRAGAKHVVALCAAHTPEF